MVIKVESFKDTTSCMVMVSMLVSMLRWGGSGSSLLVSSFSKSGFGTGREGQISFMVFSD